MSQCIFHSTRLVLIWSDFGMNLYRIRYNYLFTHNVTPAFTLEHRAGDRLQRYE